MNDNPKKPDTLRLEQLRAMFEEAEYAKNRAYHERDQLVAALSKLFPSHLADHVGEDWGDEWRNVVFIQLPTGQVSWHIHQSEADLFSHLDRRPNNRDGHTTEDKYNRLRML